MGDVSVEQMAANWRRANPAHVRQLTEVIRTMEQDPDTWAPVWGAFVIGLAERAIVQGRPLSRRQNYALIGALRDAHARRAAAGLPPTAGLGR